jgi:hypothetical protein
MSIDVGLRNLRLGVLSRVTYAVGRARRTTAGPALVRLTLGLAALAALAFAVPLAVLGGAWIVLLAAIGLGVALFPRTRWVSLVALLVIVGWLVTTVVFGEPVTPWRLGGLAIALYAMHSAAALAAVLPLDTVVAPSVLLRWLGRTGAVLGASLALGLGGYVVAAVIPGARSAIGPIVGSGVAAALAFLLFWYLRRRT